MAELTNEQKLKVDAFAQILISGKATDNEIQDLEKIIENAKQYEFDSRRQSIKNTILDRLKNAGELIKDYEVLREVDKKWYSQVKSIYELMLSSYKEILNSK